MHFLGFKYEVRKKSYYVDGHERPDTVMYRKRFVKRYLQYERRTYRWIQVSLDSSNKLKEDTPNLPKGHQYVNEQGETMVEYHVDDHPSFSEQLGGTPFGGNLSVRKQQSDKPLIIMGQDECIFKQYLFSHKSWVAPDGTRALIPKDEGAGVMISAIASREFGFGMKITEDELRRVNEYRQGKQYSDCEAAVQVQNTANKKPLTSSPFVIEFEY